MYKSLELCCDRNNWGKMLKTGRYLCLLGKFWLKNTDLSHLYKYCKEQNGSNDYRVVFGIFALDFLWPHGSRYTCCVILDSGSNRSCCLPVGDSDQELGGVWVGSCCCCRCFAAQSPGQHCLTSTPWNQGQSPGPDPRQPDSSDWKSAA